MSNRDDIRARMAEVPVEDATRTEYEKLANDEWFRYRAGPELADMQRATIATLRELGGLYFEDPVTATRMLQELVASAVRDWTSGRPSISSTRSGCGSARMSSLTPTS